MTATQAERPIESGALGRERGGKDLYIQALRGLAIAAVALIHCLPESAASVVLRPFFNWAVAMFLFLSGLLTTEEKVMRGVIGKTTPQGRIAIPGLERDLHRPLAARVCFGSASPTAHGRGVGSDVLSARVRPAGRNHPASLQVA